MEEMIVVQLRPTSLKHEVYIMSNNTEDIPHIVHSSIQELPSVIAMSAAKYNIHCIKLAGPRDYTSGIQNTIKEKINTCFGINNDFTIELM